MRLWLTLNRKLEKNNQKVKKNLQGYCLDQQSGSTILIVTTINSMTRDHISKKNIKIKNNFTCIGKIWLKTSKKPVQRIQKSIGKSLKLRKERKKPRLKELKIKSNILLLKSLKSINKSINTLMKMMTARLP